MGALNFDLLFPDHRLLDDGTRQVEHAAAVSERLRLARELHDGVLQSLTGAAVQLEAMSTLVDKDPDAARERLREIHDLIVEEQRKLRTCIENMREVRSASVASHADLAASLERLCRRITRWGTRVELAGPDSGSLPKTLSDQVYRLVEEALSNVTQHSRAHGARVEVKFLDEHVNVVVEDDGCGFPFRGRYDLAALNARRLGPFSIKERVAALRGELALTSTLSGSRLEMRLPLQ